jgi:hypothetical protein
MNESYRKVIMKKLAIFVAVMALAGFGLAQPASASGFGQTQDDEDDPSTEAPPELDITNCYVGSDGDGIDPGVGEITLMMTLGANPNTADNNAKWRFHLDYEGDFATDHTPGSGGCEEGVNGTTSDDTCKVTWKDGPSVFKVTGPCDCGVVGSVVTCTVPYADLGAGLSGEPPPGDPLLAWCDTQLKGIVDRAPDTTTEGGDTCSKPESLAETLEIDLDAPDPI